MRVYHKLKEDNDSVLYEYRYEFVSEPLYTGLVEYKKKSQTALLLKPADGEFAPDRAWAYVQTTLASKGFPEQYTHTAS